MIKEENLIKSNDRKYSNLYNIIKNMFIKIMMNTIGYVKEKIKEYV